LKLCLANEKKPVWYENQWEFMLQEPSRAYQASDIDIMVG